MMSFSFSLMLQSTSLLRGKTGAGTAIPQDEMSFNPLPSCEGRRPLRAHHCRAPRASIHFPLAREDPAAGKRCRNLSNASIHFPLAREDNPMYSRCASLSLLQSTSLLRGKTPCIFTAGPVIFASIHFPLAREDNYYRFSGKCKDASIHFPLAREDAWRAGEYSDYTVLQSTSLLRGKTARARMTDRLQRMLQSTSLLRGKTFLQCSS